MDFKDIVGQQDIIGRLKKSVAENKIGHAYLLTGPKGIGKRTVAKAFSHMLLCNMPTQDDACNTCASCKMWNENTNPDYYQIETQEDNIRVDEIRELQNHIAVKPLFSNKKVYLIVDAEKMNVQAQNCLLKVLEEPPRYAVIILTTSNYGSLLSTIRSRGSKYNFSKYTQDEIRKVINIKSTEIHEKVEKENLDFIIHYSDGIIGTAINLAMSSDFVELREKTFGVISKLSKTDDMDYFNIYDIFDKNKENTDIILDMISIFFRDLMVVKAGGKESMLINSDKRNKIVNEARSYSIEKLVKNIELIESTRKSIKQNINYQLCIETMIIKFQEEQI